MMTLQLKRAIALLDRKKPETNKAIPLLKQVLKVKNKAPWPAWHYMGVALIQKREYEKAATYLREALKRGSDEPETWHLLSMSCLEIGRLDEAGESGQEALRRRPDFFKAWLNLGSVYRAQAKLDEALKCYQRANQLDPRSAGVAFRIANIYRDQGDLKKALELYDITLKIDAEYFEVLCEKARLLQKMYRFDEARETIYQLLKQKSHDLEARLVLCDIDRAQGNYEEAISRYEEILSEHPGFAAVRVNYALSLQEIGRFEESEKNYLRAFRDQPEQVESVSNYLMGLHYNPKRSREEIFEAHAMWDEHFSPDVRPERPVPSDRSPDRKLRIGLISGGFWSHPVGWMITLGLENLPKERFEIFCYTTNNMSDHLTRRIHEASAGWKSVIGYSDEIIAGIIRDDEIDILVELSGHSADNRLKMVVKEPAPVIVKWVGGLFNTTGLKAVDYLITDWHETPGGVEDFYTEKLVRMPDDYICFQPPEYAPEVEPLPALEKGHVTFGCFNNPTKVNPALLEKWAEIMNRVPGSRLMLKSRQYDTEMFTRQIAEQLEALGITADRLEFDGHSPHTDLLAKYNEVDVALDPWPYSGGLSTCEALWMGVPVVTLPGPTFAGRHSATHLANAGLPEMVTGSWEEYVEKAVALASDKEGLAELRSGLREQVRLSPLCDGERFGAHLGVAFREMWKQRVAGWESGAGEWRDHIAVEALEEVEVEVSAGADTSKKGTRVANGSHQVDQPDLGNGLATEQPVSKNGSATKQTAKSFDNDVIPDSPPSDQEEYAADIKDAWLVPLTHGTRLYVPPTVADPVSYALLERQGWYEPEIDFLTSYLKSGMNVLEMDATYGMFTIPIAQKVGPEGKVNVWVEKKKERAFVLKSGERNELNNINALESYPSQLGDLGQVDVLIVAKLAQFNDLHSTKPKVVLINNPADDESVKALFKALSEAEFKPFVYVESVGILTEVSEQDVAEPHITRLVAVNNHAIDNLKSQGFIFNGGEELIEPESTYWRGRISEMPWSDPVCDEWESLPEGEAVTVYEQALNWTLVGTDKSKSGSYRASALLKAADLLIDLFNAGFVYRPVSLTMVRVLNDLGKREQALSVLKRVMQTKADAEENKLSLPFLPVLAMQEEIPVRDNFGNWLTVRTIEAWLILDNHSMHNASQDNLKLLAALHNNIESSAILERMYAVASMRTNNGFFSQFGEDKVLDEILSPSREKGFYVDIGAFDPMKYSNTLRLHLFGWEGVNVDANHDSIQNFEKSRPSDKNVYAAVTETNGTVNFFKADKLGEVNTLSSKHRKKWQKRGVSYDAVQVPSRRLDDILDEVVPDGQQIDFMSIDVEEAEMGVLKSNNWEKYRPNVIAIEVHGFNPDRPEQYEVAKTLIDRGYEVVKNSEPTVIFRHSDYSKKNNVSSFSGINGTEKASVELNKVLLVLPGEKGGAHGLIVKFAHRLSEQMRIQGIETEFVHATTGDFLKKVVYASEEPGTGIYTGAMGYDLRVQADMNIQGSIFDMLNKKAVAYLGDHPYTQFMWSRLHHAGKNIVYVTACESIKKEYETIFGTTKDIVHVDQPPALTKNALLDKVPETGEREIDLLIPLGLQKHFVNQLTISEELAKYGDKAKKVGMGTYNAVLTDYSSSVFEIFLQKLKEQTGIDHQFSGIQRKEDQVWLSIVSTVDWYIRKERRIRLLNGLAKVDTNKKILITASPKLQQLIPQLKSKNINWIGEVNNDRLEQLYLQSKQVLNSNPTYPDGIHERIRSAMISGAAVISDYSSLLEETFVANKGISFVGTDGGELADHLERSTDEIQQIATNGREVIQKKFSVDSYTKRLLTVIEKAR